jgi:hypothetical protein
MFMRANITKRAWVNEQALSIMRLNQLVAILALVLACCVALMLYKFGFPAKIIYGAAVLSILFVAIIWSTACLILGAFDEDDE